MPAVEHTIYFPGWCRDALVVLLFRRHGYVHLLVAMGPWNLPRTGTAKKGERHIEVDDAALTRLIDGVEMPWKAPPCIKGMAHGTRHNSDYAHCTRQFDVRRLPNASCQRETTRPRSQRAKTRASPLRSLNSSWPQSRCPSETSTTLGRVTAERDKRSRSDEPRKNISELLRRRLLVATAKRLETAQLSVVFRNQRKARRTCQGPWSRARGGPATTAPQVPRQMGTSRKAERARVRAAVS